MHVTTESGSSQNFFKKLLLPFSNFLSISLGKGDPPTAGRGLCLVIKSGLRGDAARERQIRDTGFREAA